LFLLARLVERVHQADTAAPPVPVDLQGVFEDVVEQVADSRDDDSFPDLGFRSSLLVEQLPETLTGDPTEHNDNYGDKGEMECTLLAFVFSFLNAWVLIASLFSVCRWLLDHNDPAAGVDETPAARGGDGGGADEDDEDDDTNVFDRAERADPVAPLLHHGGHHRGGGEHNKEYGAMGSSSSELPSVSE
jgi:hypothetical protein